MVLAYVVRVTTGGAAHKAVAAAFVGVAMTVLDRLGVRAFRRELRNQPIPIRIGIGEAGLTVKVPDVESACDWAALRAFVAVEDGIEM